MNYKNLMVIGTSHIAKQSLEDVKEAIEGWKPDIVALELDKRRLYSLFRKPGKIRIYDIKRIGIKGFIFFLVGAWAEKKLGDMVGVAPGSEMKNAIGLARKNNIKIALIDQDIEITLRRFSKSLTWKEKWNFFVDILKSIFSRKKAIDFDLTKVPSKKIIKKLIDYVKKRYPNVYKTLVEDRNKYMVNKLVKLMRDHPEEEIIAVVGAGHKKGMEELLLKVDVV